MYRPASPALEKRKKQAQSLPGTRASCPHAGRLGVSPGQDLSRQKDAEPSRPDLFPGQAHQRQATTSTTATTSPAVGAVL